MKEYKADRRAQVTIQVVSLIGTAVLIGLIWYFLIFFPRWLLWTLTVILIAAAVILSVFLLPEWLRRLSYTVSETHITRRGGIFFVHEQIMRTQAIQFSTVIRLPAADRTGMYMIPLHAYGGTVLLLFLSRQDADEIQAFLHRIVYRQPETKI